MKPLQILFLSFLLLKIPVFAQHRMVQLVVKDAVSGETLPGVTVSANGLNGSTSIDGKFSLQILEEEFIKLRLSLIGYHSLDTTIALSKFDSGHLLIQLFPEEKELAEVTVSTVRTGSRMEDQITKVEVIGKDDVEEEAAIAPSTVASLLGDLSIITIQRVNPVSSNDMVRLQGLDTRYTQLMRDGFPLFGGFSGSLGVLSIPPLDLKQIEIIKGSSSTLYGPGAMAGLINFISKSPEDSLKNTLLMSASSLGEYSVNNFFSTKREKIGMTLFTGSNLRSAVDINHDGFSEVPQQRSLTIHPRFFFQPKNNTEIIVGVKIVNDKRRSGDMIALERQDGIHVFTADESSARLTPDLIARFKLGSSVKAYVKSAQTFYKRSSQYGSHLFGAKQLNGYSEAGFNFSVGSHSFTGGINVINMQVKPDENVYGLQELSTLTSGIFIQDDFQIGNQLTVQPACRWDRSSSAGSFFLPRLSVHWKATKDFSLRFAGGTGYAVPTSYDVIDPVFFGKKIITSPAAERSTGWNMDVNYHALLFNELGVQWNQAFYFTNIVSPVGYSEDSAFVYLASQGGKTYSYGSDTYLRLTYHEWECYVGFNHTIARINNGSTAQYVPFNPTDKFSTTLTFEAEDHFRIGLESSYVSGQFLPGEKRVKNFWFFAGLAEYRFRQSSLIVNVENIADFRQSRIQPLVGGTLSNPVFAPLWGPVEGRVFTLSWKWKIG